ncbi:kinase-like protein [Plenodomus tracheiphilus IPT5]|uniref:Kinase-like protein n=1 Tax=Plenodomus tracheiphilus IPT5 TaxID=1408161 RepID=A0A6A7B3P0_9PLEO|nr:kinase-like protein [Plenodomus tracheiphilus IPT5]
MLKAGNFSQTIPGPTTNLFKTGKCIGGGNQGEVFELFVDKAHRTFGSSLDENLVIKIIEKGKPAESNERNALEFFQNANTFSLPGMTKSYTGFDLDGKFHFISERAASNLKELLGSKPGSDINIVWLRKQSRDLAEALLNIHESGGDSIGMHHDIRRSNILVFPNQNSQLKLTDWGYTAVQKAAHFTKQSSANPPYSPPESAPPLPAGQARNQSEETAQPHDIWALGRIFLDLLVWVKEGQNGYTSFRNDVKNGGRKFWVEIENAEKIKSQVLSQVVKDVLAKYQLSNDKETKHLAGVIEEMLKIDASGRLLAKEVFEQLS